MKAEDGIYPFGPELIVDAHEFLDGDGDGDGEVTVLRSYPGPVDQPASPAELAEWVSRVLRLKSYKGPSRRSPGIARLSRWVVNRMAEQPQRAIRPTELLDKARRWLPDSFEGVRIDPHTLKAYPKVRTIEVAVETAAQLGRLDPSKYKAIFDLARHDPNPDVERRARKLSAGKGCRKPAW